MGAPRIDQINVVLADVEGATRFLGGLGVGMPAPAPGWEAWASHHVNTPPVPEFAVDLDSSAFAAVWGGLDPGYTGLVVNLRVDERSEVDMLHDQAQALGGRSVKAPYDAFWGSRFAIVEGPGPLYVGLMSPMDEAHRTAPPELASFA